MAQLTCTSVAGLPLIAPGDELAPLIRDGMSSAGIESRSGDILVVAQKIVSKSEGRYLSLGDVQPGAQARELAAVVGRDPRYVEAVLSESRAVVRAVRDLLVVENRNGFVMANAGIDQSNIEHDGEEDRVLLLPLDPDASAVRLRDALADLTGTEFGIIISDSFGRPWRRGITGVAIGAAGLPAISDLAGEPDLFGRPLQHTERAIGDELAAAASLLMGQAAEGCPVVHIRGFGSDAPPMPATALVRPREQDRFR